MITSEKKLLDKCSQPDNNKCMGVLHALNFVLVEIRQTSEKGITSKSINSKVSAINYWILSNNLDITQLKKRLLTNVGHTIYVREVSERQLN